MIPTKPLATIVLLALVCYANATQKVPIKEMTCDKNLPYSRVFDVTNAYKKQPKPRTSNEGADHFCGHVEQSCCLAESGLFKNLNHYWENVNSADNYSKDLSSWTNRLGRMVNLYTEIWHDRATVVLKKASISESFKKRIAEVRKFKLKLEKKEILMIKKCFANIKLMMHGAMCSMCSPETYQRIVEDKIYFDIREAAVFARDCGGYILFMRSIVEDLEVISQIMAYDEHGKKLATRKKQNFLAFWDSDEQYLAANIKKNMDGCKLVNDNLDLSSVKPSDTCGQVISSYMGIGPLIKFDQKVWPQLAILTSELEIIYEAMITGTSTKAIRRLEESQQEEKSTSTERILSDDSNWDPEDGLKQMMWKNKKHFQSVMLDGDLFEYSMTKMGEGSKLNGFEFEKYEIFINALDDDRCAIAKMFGAKTESGVNIRDPKVETICPYTKLSCCNDDWYNNMNEHWLKFATHEKKIMRLENELVQMLFRWLNEKDSDGLSALRKKLDTIKADPNCTYQCKLQITGLGLYKTQFNDPHEQLEYLQGATKCSNHLLQKKATWLCPICDQDFRSIMKTNKLMSIGEVHTDPSMCADVFKGCWKNEISTANLFQGVYHTALRLIKFWKKSDWLVKDFKYRDIGMNKVKSCSPTWDKFKGVSRNIECIELCENLWNDIITPKPKTINQGFFTGLKILFENLGTDPGLLTRLDELKKLNVITDPYLKPFDEIPHFEWVSAWRAKNTDWIHFFEPFKSQEKKGIEGEVWTNGLEKQALLIPFRVSGASLVGIGRLVIGVVSLLLVFGIGG